MPCFVVRTPVVFKGVSMIVAQPRTDSIRNMYEPQ